MKFRLFEDTHAAYIGLAALFFVVYFAAIIVPYAFLDDYTALCESLRHHLVTDIVPFIVEGGRPGFALLYLWAFRACHSISDLSYLRAIGILGIAVLAIYCYRALLRTAVPRSAAFAFAALIGLMPPFQVYAAWANTAFDPWAALLAGLAFKLVHGEGSTRIRWLRGALSVFVLTCSLAIYQPAAMLFWLFAGIAWLTTCDLPDRNEVVRAGITMAIALGLDFAMAKILPYAVFGITDTFARTALVSNVYGKLAWFISSPLRDALNLPSITPTTWLAGLVAGFIIGGLWLYFPDKPRVRALKMTLSAALIPLAYLPNLIVSENWSSYRTQSGITSIVLFYAVLALIGWMQTFRTSHLIPACAVLAVFACAASASRNVLLEFAVPQVVEYNMVAHALSDTKLHDAKGLYFYQPKWPEDKFAKAQRYDEFGILSSYAAWVPQCMAWLILHNSQSPDADRLFESSLVGRGPVPAGYTVIDLLKALHH